MKNILPLALMKAFTNMLFSILGRVEPYREGCGYLNNILFYMDIFGNAITGGNPKVTVSARVGYFYNKTKDEPKVEKDFTLVMDLFLDIFRPLFSIAASKTISQRVLVFIKEFKKLTTIPKGFWSVCRYIIDSAFAPVDGKDHCVRAYHWTTTVVTEDDGKPINIQKGYKGFFIPLLVVIVLACALIWPFIRALSKLGLVSPP